MKVLWLCNVILPKIAKAIGAPIVNTGGWLIGLSNELRKTEGIELGIIFPYSKNIRIVVDGIACFGFSNTKIEIFKSYIQEFSPDVIHVFGTESFHSYQMVSAAEELGLIDNTVISIQGMVSVYEKHFFANLPHNVIHKMTLRDLLKRDSIWNQHNKFVSRGNVEIKTIMKAKHVIGRTDWDEACTKRINPKIEYYYCNESLRNSFYVNSGTWKVEKCEQHSIFVSQCGYPIKGFHLMLEAMVDIVKKYPDAKLYTTGNTLINRSVLKRMRHGYYQYYIEKLIHKYHLEKNVVFWGSLDEEEMCKAYLKSNVFVCCSSIENSPNSLGEAMILGVPCVSADVGGVKNMLVDKQEGFIYPYDEPYLCAYYVMKFFENSELMKSYSTRAFEHANRTHDVVKNNQKLLSIYNAVKKN